MHDMTTLDNGLRVLTVTLPHVQSVSLGFFLAVGSRYESAEIAGISHFAEHMLFKGTQRWPTPRDIAEAIEGRGGIVNASTGLETTLYWAKVAASHTSEAMEVLSDMLLRATFEPVSYTHLRAHETVLDLVCRLLLEKKKDNYIKQINAHTLQYSTSYRSH